MTHGGKPVCNKYHITRPSGPLACCLFIEHFPRPGQEQVNEQAGADEQRGQLSWELSRLMVRRMQRASEIIETLAFQPVAARLAKLLMDTFQDDSTGPIARNMTLDEMAARIGSTREVVCRFLHRFADEGLINITRTEFIVSDRERLIELAQKNK